MKMGTIINGVVIQCPPDVAPEQIETILQQEIDSYKILHKPLGGIDIEIDGEELIVRTWERSPIKRLRRITGYISNIENFNDAKLSELAERDSHVPSDLGSLQLLMTDDPPVTAPARKNTIQTIMDKFHLGGK